MRLTPETLQLMKELTEACGIPGQERNVTRKLKGYYEELCDEVVYDNLGSVYGIRKSRSKDAFRVMIAAHCDEVGMAVRRILPNGLLQLTAVGGVWELQLLSRRVTVFTDSNQTYPGCMVANSSKLPGQAPKENVLEYSFCDCGFASEEEARLGGVMEGNMAAMDCPFTVLNGGKRLMAKAWDDRYGCVLGVELLQALKDEELPFDLSVGANVQEEVGLRGAGTAAQLIQPDLAIVADCTSANDIPSYQTPSGGIGQGAMVRFMDRTYLPNRTLLMDYLEILKQNGIKYQWHQAFGGTDAGVINLTGQGIPVLTACICARGVHTGASVIDAEDYLGVRKGLELFLRSLDSKKLKAYRENNR